MKNIIHDQKYVMLGIVSNSSSLPANQNSKRQDQLGLKIQKSLPLSLTPCFSPRKVSGQQNVEVTLINTLLQQGVALPHADFNGFNRFPGHRADQRAFKFKNLFAPSSRLSPSLPTPKIFTPKRPVN